MRIFFRAFESGPRDICDGCLARRSLKNIRAVMRENRSARPHIIGLAFGRMSALAREMKWANSNYDTCLTRREAEIVRLIDEGLSNKENHEPTAYREVSTVKNHVHNILDKLHPQSSFRREVPQRAKPLPPVVFSHPSCHTRLYVGCHSHSAACLHRLRGFRKI